MEEITKKNGRKKEVKKDKRKEERMDKIKKRWKGIKEE